MNSTKGFIIQSSGGNMASLGNPKNTIEIIQKYEFMFQKKFGQNFLIATNVLEKIISSAGVTKEDCVLEIGPGIGPLTNQLALRAGKVTAIELDRSLLPILAETMAPHSNVEIISGDAMKLNLTELVAEKFNGFTAKACANLPYNITTPVITKLLEAGCFRSITVMIQKEVAQRICAAPGNSDCGAFSLFCQYYAECSLLFEVPPECFLPAPKVTSAVIQLIPRSSPPVDADPKVLFSVIKAAFAQRRKTLLNGLSAAYGNRYTKDQLRQLIIDSGLSESVRGERLSLDDFARLANFLQ